MTRTIGILVFDTMFPQVRVHEDRRWIDEGTVVTSGGISAGIDMALRTARQMNYHWRDA